MKILLDIFILAALLSFRQMLSIKQSDFCKIGKPICKGFLESNNYKESCEKMKCDGIYKFTCLNGLCSKDKNQCDIYKNLNFLTRPIAEFKFNRIKFIRNLKDCLNTVYNFKQNDVCVTEKNCYYREVFTRLSRVNNFESLVQKSCECRGLYNFKCGENFCAIHSYACEMFTASKMNFVNMKSCGNGNQLTQKLFFYPI